MKKLFCMLTVICMLAMLVAVGSMSASAAEFNGNKDKVTPELLATIEQSGENDVLTAWLWYEDVTDMQQVASEIAARVAEALADKVSIPYDTLGDILDKAGLGELKEGALAQIESILNENADRSNEWKITEVNIMTERYLSFNATEKKADALITALGIKGEQILFKSKAAPSMVVKATVGEIEKFTENDIVITVDLYTESEVIEPAETETKVIEPTATNAEPVTPVLYGDANGDGDINTKDVLTLRSILCGHINFIESENVWIFWDHHPEHPKKIVTVNEANADANIDGQVNMKDVLVLRQIIAYGNVYSEQNPLAYTLEERVHNVFGGDGNSAFPEAAILRSPADVEALFAKSSHYNFSTGTSAPVYPKNTYDDAFFAERFLVVLQVANGYIDLENPVSGVFKGEAGSLVIHTNNNWAVSPWEVQDALLISLPLSELGTFHTLYEVRRTPIVNYETGEYMGYSHALYGRYDV